MKKLLLILALFSAAPLWGQTCTTATCNAATANESDVLAALPASGNTNATVVVSIPAGTVTWTTGIVYTIPSAVTSLSIIGAGTPNSGVSSFTAGTSTTVITQNTTSSLFAISPIPFGTTLRISLLSLAPQSGLTTEDVPIKTSGTCTSSGCPNVRIDNITFDGAYNNDPADADTVANNVFGVYDHNTVNNSSGGIGPALVQLSHSAWQGLGDQGNNSFAQPSTFGTNQALFVENNTFNSARATENDIGFNGLGGGRVVIRYNVHNTTGQVLAFGHGTAWGGTFRGERQKEVYRNTIVCSGSCDDDVSIWSGTGLVFQNNVGTSGSGFFNKLTGMDVPRSWRADSTTPSWGWCTGQGYYDQNATYTPATGNHGTVTTSGTASMSDSSQSWTTNQWFNSGTPYSVNDSTPTIPIGCEIASNTATSITCAEDMIFNTFNLGDTYQIRQATLCLDQPGRSGGTYLSGSSGPLGGPTPTGWPGEVLDPVYSWANTTPAFVPSMSIKGARLIANRDYYSELSVNQTAQTSPTSPFDGTSGTGYGTRANRPTTCTTGVGYFSTDQGSWNTGGAGGQGVLDKCTSTNTWTNAAYTPYTYPHPLAGGSGVSLTVSTSGTGSGTVTGSSCTSGSYSSGSTIGPCTANATSGSTFTGWTATGSAACSGTTNPCPSFSLTATTTVTAAFAAQTASPTFTPSSLSSPGFVTVASATSGAACYYTVDGSTPTTGSAQITHPLYIGQSQTLKAICSASGYTNSSVGSQAYAPAVAKTKFAISAIAASENTNPFPNPNRSIAVEWLNVLTTPATDCNTYNWAPLDAWTTQSAAKGVANLYTFSHVPQCANGTTNNANPPTDLTTGDTFFKNFVTAFWEHECSLSSPPSTPLTAASCNNMKYVETWNEDNTDLYWTDTYAHKAIMDNDMAGITKTFCSDCIVILGSVSAGGSGSHANGQSGYYDVAMLTEATAWAALSPFNPPDAVSIHDYWSRSNISPPPFVTTIASNSDATCTTGNTPNSSCYVPVIQEFSRVQGSAVLQNSAISSWAANLPVFGTEGGYGHVSNLCASTPSLCVNGIAEHMVGVASQNASTHSVPIDLLYASNTCTSPNDWGCYWNNGTSPQLPAINEVISWLGANTITGSLTSSAITGGNKWTLPLSGGEIDFCDAWLANCITSTSFNTQQHLDGTVTTLSGTVTLTKEPTLLASATTYTLSTATAGSGSGTVTGCAGSVNYGAGYSCTVTPAGGSSLVSVTGCGGSGTTTYTGTMPASNCTVTATFNLSAAPSVSISGSGTLQGTVHLQ